MSNDNPYETIETIKTEIKSISRRLRVLSEMLPSEMEERRVEIETLSERKSQLWTILKKANALIWKLVDEMDVAPEAVAKPVPSIPNSDDKFSRKYMETLLKKATEYLDEAYYYLTRNGEDNESQVILTECFNKVNGVLGNYEEEDKG